MSFQRFFMRSAFLKGDKHERFVRYAKNQKLPKETKHQKLPATIYDTLKLAIVHTFLI